jgi:hypothetical protein
LCMGDVERGYEKGGDQDASLGSPKKLHTALSRIKALEILFLGKRQSASIIGMCSGIRPPPPPPHAPLP